MLDQPVPNPLAKNPEVHTHKVFATVGLILIGVIIAIGGIWWYYSNQIESEEDKATTETTKVSTSSAKKSTESAKKDETADWKEVKSDLFKYSVKIPKDWVYYSETSNFNDQGSEGEYTYLNLVKSEDLSKKNTPYIQIYGNVATDWCGGGPGPICTNEDVSISGVAGKKYTYINEIAGDEVYFFDSKDVVIFVTKKGQGELTDQIISTFKFL